MTSLFLQTLKGTPSPVPPIWFMRQAGRYLPEYRAVRGEAGSFLDLCYNPDFATSVTLQPIDRYDLDAAILFADILLIPHAMGIDLQFQMGEGPKLSPLVRPETIGQLSIANIHDTLSPIYQTVKTVRAKLSEEKALIGFAGAPWTVATYMLAGQGVKDPSALRSIAYDHPQMFDNLIGMLTEATIDYLLAQVEAGADALQLFDSWASGLPEPFFDKYCAKPVIEIAGEIKAKADVPIIAFPRGAGPLYSRLAEDPNIDGVSIDTGLPASYAVKTLSPHATVQGGLDPLLVVQGGQEMFEAAEHIISTFKGHPYIFNLGHGFVPETPPENVAALVKFIRDR